MSKNKAAAEFENGHLNFSSWYSPQIIENLTHLDKHNTQDEEIKRAKELAIKINPEELSRKSSASSDGWMALHFAVQAVLEEICRMIIQRTPEAINIITSKMSGTGFKPPKAAALKRYGGFFCRGQ